MKSSIDDVTHEELDTDNQKNQQQPQTTVSNQYLTTDSSKPATNANEVTEEEGYLVCQYLSTCHLSVFFRSAFLYLAGSKEAQFLVPDLGGMRSTIGIGLPHRRPRLQRLAGRYDSLMP
jgi:hypothetical protein